LRTHALNDANGRFVPHLGHLVGYCRPSKADIAAERRADRM